MHTRMDSTSAHCIAIFILIMINYHSDTVLTYRTSFFVFIPEDKFILALYEYIIGR